MSSREVRRIRRAPPAIGLHELEPTSKEWGGSDMSKQLIAVSALALIAFGCDRPNKTNSTSESMNQPAPPMTTPEAGYGSDNMGGGYGGDNTPPASEPGGGGMGGGPMSGEESSVGGGPKAEMVTIGAATDRIASSHCKIELKCSQKTKDVKAKTMEACLADNKKMVSKGVNATSCPNGIDQAKLSSCLDKIDKSSCDDIKTKVDSIDACKSSSLCP
jgi:hypothetical protein